MPRAIPIRRPAPDADRPNPRGLALVALVCFGVGLALSAKTLTRTTGDARNARTDEPAATPRFAAPATPSASPPVATRSASPGPIAQPTPTAPPTPIAQPTPPAPSSAELPTTPAAPPTPPAAVEVAPPPRPAMAVGSSLAPSGVRIERGRIAYIRCEGVPQRDGPVPCPRDPAMERVVWTAIDGLPARCPALATARGTADVRVVFDGRRFSGLGFHPDTPPSLAEAVRTCLEPQLNGLTQSLGATRLTASFRFDAK